jgi:TonB-dependent receptor
MSQSTKTRLMRATGHLCLFTCVAGLALLGQVAQAQQRTPVAAPSPDDTTTVDEIIVTGSVLRGIAEIENRRATYAIVDTISQDEIGSLPDLTIAETMRRITGVTTIYNDDIGQFASIRGVHPDFVPVTINGLSLATTGDLGEGTRKVNLQVIPGQGVRTIEAYKTPTPDLDAGALGGLINIVPVSAFDPGASNLIVSSGISYSTYMEVPDINSWGDNKDSPIGGSVNVLWSDRFGSTDNIGVTLTGIYEYRPRTQSNDAVTNRLYYTSAGVATTPESANWNGFAAPNSFLTHAYTNRFERSGGTARIDYRPSDSISTTLYGFLYMANEQETRNTNRLFQLDQPQNLGDEVGSMRVRSADTQWRFNTFERNQWGLQWLMDAQLSERSSLSGRLGYSHADFFSDRPFVSFVYRPNTRVTYDLNNDGQRFVLPNPEAYLNPANFLLGETFRDGRDTYEDVFEGRLDYEFNTGVQARGFGFSAGANVRLLDIERDIESVNYVTGRLALTGLGFAQGFSDVGYPYPSLWINPDAFWGGAVNTVAVDPVLSNASSRLSDYRYTEDVYAAYATASWANDQLFVQGGLRYDAIEAEATNTRVVGGVIQNGFTTRATDYANVLPYVMATYSALPNLRFKAAATVTLGRPNPEDIATSETVDRTELTISRGNTDLEPRQSTNLDLGFEYFFNGGDGLIAVTAFRKDIKDDILTVSREEEIDGQLWTVTQPINGEDTLLQGVEVGIVSNSFDFIHPALAGLGASANYLYVEGESRYIYSGVIRETDQLLWQSESSANVSVFYNLGEGSEVRVAMNHKSDYLESYAANPWQDIYIEPFTTVDVTGIWAIAPDFSLRLEGRNVFDENRARSTGPGHRYHRAGLEMGSTYFLTLTYRR